MSIFSRLKKGDDYDRVEVAWKSQDLKKMTKALKWKPKKPLNRHFLLLFIVQNTFLKRKDSDSLLKLCEETARVHISELNTYKPLLLKQFGELPNMQTHHYLATILAESCQYDAAIHVCLDAMQMGFPPGKGGSYKVRIKQFEDAKQNLIH